MSDLARTLDDVWQRLGRGVADRRAPARHPVLATTGPRGAEARLVVLRAADRAEGTLALYTDAATSKVTQLAADPRATLLVWEPKPRLQIRLRVHVTARPGTAHEWAGLSTAARRVYGGSPPPGAPIAAPADHDAAPDAARFTVLTARIDEIETLRLVEPHHERAVFARADGFRGSWRAP